MTDGFDTTGSLPTIVKDPQAKLVYGRNWAPWMQAGDTVADAIWVIVPEAGPVADDPLITLEVDAQYEIPSGRTTARLIGGKAGVTYKVTVHVITAVGDEDDRSFKVKCRER